MQKNRCNLKDCLRFPPAVFCNFYMYKARNQASISKSENQRHKLFQTDFLLNNMKDQADFVSKASLKVSNHFCILEQNLALECVGYAT